MMDLQEKFKRFSRDYEAELDRLNSMYATFFLGMLRIHLEKRNLKNHELRFTVAMGCITIDCINKRTGRKRWIDQDKDYCSGEICYNNSEETHIVNVLGAFVAEMHDDYNRYSSLDGVRIL